MDLSRRGLILGCAALAGSCATAGRRPSPVLQAAAAPPPPSTPVLPPARATLNVVGAAQTNYDPKGWIRQPLLKAGLDAYERHGRSLTNRDRIYLVDFSKHSSQQRLFELDMHSGEVRRFRTAHGQGSDPSHSGFARLFSNVENSHASSVGAYVTGGPGMGAKHGPNTILEGLDPTNSAALARAIIVHGADYCEPEYLAAHGKLGRSFGCFATAAADLQTLRPRLGEGRLLFAAA